MDTAKEKAMNSETETIVAADFDPAPYLDSDTAVAAYLTDVLNNHDADQLASALGGIARARGIGEIARMLGIPGDALYKDLRMGNALKIDTVNQVCAALGVRLVVQPVEP
jgi:probable addiction module antidote protein